MQCCNFFPHVHLFQVFFVDYGNCEIVPRNDIIPEAVRPDLSPQAIGLKFTSLFRFLLNQPAERQATPPSPSGADTVSQALLTDDQYTSLSQLLVDETITMEIRGTDDRGLLIASCGVIDSWIQRQLLEYAPVL